MNDALAGQKKKKKKKKKRKKGNKDKEKLIGVADSDAPGEEGEDLLKELNGDPDEKKEKKKKPDKEEQALQQLWDILDTDASGLLNLDETRAVFSAMGHELPEKKFQRTYKQIDKNGNGDIEFDELLVWWRKQKSGAKKSFGATFEKEAGGGGGGGAAEEEGVDPTADDIEGVEGQKGDVDPDEASLLAVWGVMDADGSGFLSSAETKAVFNAMGFDISEKKFAKEFKKIDADGSGHGLQLHSLWVNPYCSCKLTHHRRGWLRRDLLERAAQLVRTSSASLKPPLNPHFLPSF